MRRFTPAEDALLKRLYLVERATHDNIALELGRSRSSISWRINLLNLTNRQSKTGRIEIKVRLKPELVRSINTLAAARRTSRNRYIERILEQHFA